MSLKFAILGGVLVVHIFSGFGALVGSILVGPRVERIGDNYRDVSLPGHSLPLTAIGAMFVIIGMIGKMKLMKQMLMQLNPEWNLMTLA